MRLKITSATNCAKFSELGVGECFTIDGAPYMRICSPGLCTKDGDGHDVRYCIALQLSNGYICVFDKDQQVKSPEMELIIKQ